MDTTGSCCSRISSAWLLRRLLALCTSLACLCASAQDTASWTPLGPGGGTVSALLTSPASTTTLYAGTPANGVFVSADGGASWSVANGGLPATVVGRQTVRAVHALASDTQFIYAATAAGIFYAPVGTTPQWTALPATGAAFAVTQLAYEPSTGLLIAASNASDGVAVPGVYVAPSVRLAGAPAAWTFVALPASTAGQAIGGLAIAPPGSKAGTGAANLLVGAGTRVFSAAVAQASPVALSWTDADPSATLALGAVAGLGYSADFQLAYACSGAALYYSGNAFDSQPLWFAATLPADIAVGPVCQGYASVPVSVGGAPQLVLGTDQGAFVSLDGTSFAHTGALGLGPSANAFALGQTAAMTSTLYVGAGFGVSALAVSALQAGAAWTASSGGSAARLDNANIVDTAVLGRILYAAAVDNGYVEVLASADGGATWSATNIGAALGAGAPVLSLLADPTHGVLYAATAQGLLAYLPGGTGWSAVAPATLAGRIGALALGTASVFVGTDYGLFALPRGAAPSSATPVAAGLAGSSVRSLLLAAGSVLAGVTDAADANIVYFTSEAGADAGNGLWQAFGVGSAGTDRITGLLMVGTTLLASTNGSLVLYASVGSGWASANTSASASQQISDAFGAVFALYSDGQSVYAATGSQGVFVSPLGGTFAWTPFNGSGASALPALEVHALRASGGTLYASTRAGVASAALPAAAGGASTPSSAPAGGGSGGGAVDPVLALLLLGVLLALRGARR